MSTNYTGDPTAAESPSPAPAAGSYPIVVLPTDDDPFSAAAFYQPYKTLADYIAFLSDQARPWYFGSGYDGSHVVAGTETLDRPRTYTDLTIPNGTILNTANYPLFVSGTLTFTGGIIRCDGGAGSNAVGVTPGSAGAGVSASVFGGGTAGGAGASGGAAGTAGVANTTGHGGNGAAGGAGGGAGGAGGAAGVAGATLGNIDRELVRLPTVLSSGAVNYFSTQHVVWGGAGGGGGGGGENDIGTGGGGGGGGAGGGCCVILARKVVLALAGGVATCIRSLGGAGGNGGAHSAGSAGNGGGGAGGGGGMVAVYSALIVAPSTNPLDYISVAGGAAGTGAGASAGGVGATGIIYSNLF